MSVSDAWLLRLPAAAVLALVVQCGQSARAQDAVIRVNTSTFTDFLNTLDPISFSGRYAFRTTVDAGPFGRHTITWCNSAYQGAVDNLIIDINSSRIRVQGDVDFSWCGLKFGAPVKELVATGNAIYRPSDGTLRMNFSSVIVRPTFNAFGHIIYLPVPINVSGMLNFPALRLHPVGVGFDTAGGQRVLRLRPTNVDVDLGAGFVTVATDLALN